MQELTVGVAIGFGIEGLGDLKKSSKALENLSKVGTKLGHSLKQTTKFIDDFKKRAESISDIKIKKDNIAKEIFSIKNAITTGAMAIPVKVAMDFEDAMADVRKVVDFDSKVELSGFGKEIIALSKEIPLSAKELATITASGGQLGIAKENLLEFTTAAAKMGVAFDMGADEAGDSIGKMMNIFGMNIKEVTTLGDAINHLSDNSASKAKEIVEVLKRIGGTGKTIGLTAVQTSALASAFISLGKTPQLAATSADTLMKKLGNIKDSKEVKEALMSLGMDPEYVAEGMKIDPQKMIMTFLERVKGLDKSQQLKLLTDMFGDGFSGDIALLVNGLDTYKKALSDTADEEKYKGSSDKEFKNKIDTTTASLAGLKNSVAAVGITLGSLFLPAISEAFKNISSFIFKITELIDKFPNLTKIIVGLIGGFFAFKIAFLSINYGIYSIKQLGEQIKQTRDIAKFFIKPFSSLFSKSFSDIKIGLKLYKEQFASAFDATKRNLIKAKDMALKALKATISFVSNAFKALGRAILFTFSKVKLVAIKAYNLALKALGFTVGFVGKAFRALAVGIRIVGAAMMSNPLGLILGAIAIVAGLIIYNWDKVKAWFLKFIEWLRPVWEPVVAGIKLIWDGLTAYFNFLIDFYKGLFSGIADFLSSVFEKPVAWIKSLFEPLFDWLADKFGWISSALDGVKSGVSTALSWVGLGSDSQDNGVKTEKKSSWYNPFSWGDDEQESSFTSDANLIQDSFAPTAKLTPAMSLAGANGGSMPVNITFNGGLNIATKDGKFDLAEFEKQVTQSVKKALSKEQFNKANTDIRG